MLARISLEYSSDGPGPSQVDAILRRLGLGRRGVAYELDIPDESGLHRSLDQVHEALKGTGVRYRVSLERPEREAWAGRSQDEVARWVDAGVVDEGLIELLDKDPFEFRNEARRALDAAVDHVLSLRRAEVQESKDSRHREAIKEQISILLRSGGAKHFQEILEAFDMDERTLTAILQEMVEEGTVAAKQEDHHVVYALSGPMLRASPR